MLRNRHLSPEALREEQTRKLRGTLHHAYSTTPYYRNLFETAGVHPWDIRTLSDLSRVPISRKEDLLRVSLEDRIAKGTNIKKCRRRSTSGTTGTPWDVLISPSENLRRDLKALRAMLANGHRFFHRTCRFLDPRMLPRPHYWFQDLGFLRHRYVSLYDDLDSKVRILMEGNYDVIFGGSSGLFVLAETMLERGTAPTPPKLVVTYGEVIDSLQRRTIRQVFRRDPTDFLGSVEFGSIAWQCPERQGYHIDADHLILELVKDGTVVAPGKEGEVVITDLAPRAMPLIRFATGDWSSSSDAPCPCGIKLPTLSHISGRMWDFLLLPSGEKITPLCVTIQLEDIPGIKGFQVTQVSRSEVVVRFTRRSDAGEDPSPAILRRFGSLMGETMQLHVQEVESIPRPRGKFRVVENALLRTRGPT